MYVASNSDSYESTQEIYCNEQNFMESDRGDEALLKVLKAYWWTDEAGEQHFSTFMKIGRPFIIPHNIISVAPRKI